MRPLIALVLIVLLFTNLQGETVRKNVEYMHGDTICEGYLSYDDQLSGKRSGVLVIHEWTGINDYTKKRADMLAELGYIAFAADIYGKGIRPKNSSEASKQASIYRSDRAMMRARAMAGLEYLRNYKLTDPDKIAAIGYCFGGGTALELARGGADIQGVVSFHGNLDTPDPDDAKNIKAKILVLHGASDPHVPREQVTAFQGEMNRAGVDWYMIEYGGAVHSFTNPDSGNDPSKGAAYNVTADMRSWKAMIDFFDEIFK